MTPQQERVLDIVREHIHATGIAPTYQEIADEMILSKTAISHHVDKLVAAGQLTRRAGVHRPLGLPEHADLTIVPTSLLRAELARRGLTMEALVERPAPITGTRECAAEGCCSRVTVGRIYCRPHWWSLPESLREQLKTMFESNNVGGFGTAFTACQKNLADRVVRA